MEPLAMNQVSIIATTA